MYYKLNSEIQYFNNEDIMNLLHDVQSWLVETGHSIELATFIDNGIDYIAYVAYNQDSKVGGYTFQKSNLSSFSTKELLAELVERVTE